MWNDIIELDGITQEHSDESLAILGDALEIMKQMKSGSVDLIFADPPLYHDRYRGICSHTLESSRYLYGKARRYSEKGGGFSDNMDCRPHRDVTSPT